MRSRISIRGCVRPSGRPSVRRSVTHKLKLYKNAVFDRNYYQYERGRILCRVYGLVLSLQGNQVSLIYLGFTKKPYLKSKSRCLILYHTVCRISYKISKAQLSWVYITIFKKMKTRHPYWGLGLQKQNAKKNHWNCSSTYYPLFQSQIWRR